MNYLVVESAIVDGAQPSAVTVKDDLNEAKMLFHQIRASQLANEKVSYGVAAILDSFGHSLIQESHERIEEKTKEDDNS